MIDLKAQLRALIDAGLDFGTAVTAFAEHQTETTPELAAYQSAAEGLDIVREGECEVDSGAIVSKGEDAGAYVMAWLWVSDDDAGVEAFNWPGEAVADGANNNRES